MKIVIDVWIGVTLAEFTLVFAGWAVSKLFAKKQEAKLKGWMEDVKDKLGPGIG